jgi:quinoprotein glucose dehydrogenase
VIELDSTLRLDAPASVLRGWMQLAVQQCVDSSASKLLTIAHDANLDGSLRARALESLGEIQPYGTSDMLASTLHDDDARVRAASLTALLSVDPKGAMPLLDEALNATVPERRVAYEGMSRVARPEIDAVCARALTALDAGTVPPAVALVLVLTAGGAQPRAAFAAARRHRHAEDELLADDRFQIDLDADAEKGRDIFRGKTALMPRCHTAEIDGGVVGPNLHDVSKRLTRELILESIVDPNRRLSPGYQGTVVFTQDGPPVDGSVLEGASHVDDVVVCCGVQTAWNTLEYR